MQDPMLVAGLAAMLFARVASLRKYWRLPLRQGEGWFLSTQVEPGFYSGAGAMLLRRYRSWLIAPFVFDAPVVTLLVAAGKSGNLIFEQFVAFVLTLIFHYGVLASFSYRAKALASPVGIEVDRKPTTAVQLLLQPRRLRDHSNWGIETLIIALTLAALAMLARRWATFPGWVPQRADGEDSGEGSSLAWGFIWLLYLQVGLLLLKRVFVSWRMKLPLRRAEEYRRYREAWLRYHLRVFDAARVAWALALFGGVVHDTFGQSWSSNRVYWAVVTLGLTATALLIAYCTRERRRLAVVEREVNPMQLVKEFPPTPVADGRFLAGGLLYFNPDNPVVVARSPQGIAINLASRGTYLWGAYLSGFVTLAAWQIIK